MHGAMLTPGRWPAPPLAVWNLPAAGPGTLRPCGCNADPLVFGHFLPFGCTGIGVVR